jgi:hypothetical protein
MSMVSVWMPKTWIIDDIQLGGHYGTALGAACANEKVEVVNALLRVGASPNADGECFDANNTHN